MFSQRSAASHAAAAWLVELSCRSHKGWEMPKQSGALTRIRSSEGAYSKPGRSFARFLCILKRRASRLGSSIRISFVSTHVFTGLTIKRTLIFSIVFQPHFDFLTLNLGTFLN